MKNFLRKLQKQILPIAGIITIIIVIISASIKQNRKICKEVEIEFETGQDKYFLTEAHALQIAYKTTNPSELIGKSVDELDIYQMLLNLNESPYIENADVFMGFDGILKISIKQREPIFRVVNQQGENYYVEKNGIKIPTLKSFAVRVPIISGAVEEELSDSSYIHSDELLDAMKIFSYINSNKFWKAQIEQVYVDKNKDYLLIPMIGNHTIVLGKAEQIDAKLKKLELFYNQSLKKLGWEEYSVIDLSFDGQIIAKRRKN